MVIIANDDDVNGTNYYYNSCNIQYIYSSNSILDARQAVGRYNFEKRFFNWKFMPAQYRTEAFICSQSWPFIANDIHRTICRYIRYCINSFI